MQLTLFVIQVGIKFGERIDMRTGGMVVFVKRLVKGGPADLSRKIQPGDVLQLINGEDVYGQGTINEVNFAHE